MFKKIIIINIIVGLFLTCGVVSALDLFGDGLEPEDIYIDEDYYLDTSFSNESFKKDDGEMFNWYVYSTRYELCNISSSLKGSEIITYFYNNDELVIFHDEQDGDFNNTTETINDDNYLEEYSSVIIDAIAISDKYVNVTNFKVLIIKDNEIIFNVTQPFNMSHNIKDDIKSMNSTSDSDTSSSNSGSTYVASSDSNKFHDPYCTQAKRIKDSNKITFSSRDEAISAGYESCEICNP